MRWRMLTFALPLVAGFSVAAAMWFYWDGRGESQPVALGREFEYPAALSNLPAIPTDLTVDDAGFVWFALLQFEGEGQVNTLYRYDPATDALQTFPLPNDSGSDFVVRIEAGKGDRQGKILVGWQSTLLEVDSETGKATQLPFALDLEKFDFGGPPTTSNNLGESGSFGRPLSIRIMDIGVSADGTVWVSRDNYPYLIAFDADGSSREFALPDGAGSPDRLAVEDQGLVWATLQYHRTIDGGNFGGLTLRFDPRAERVDVLPWHAWNVAGGGGKVVAIGGRGPATVRRLDVAGTEPVGLTDFGPTFPDDELAMGSDGAVWYRSPVAKGLVRLGADGALAIFELPTLTGDLSDTFCRAHPTEGACEGTFTTQTQVFGIAVAPDGSAWFSTGNRIGHAIP